MRALNESPAMAHLETTQRIQRVVSPGGIEAWLVEEYTVPLIAMDCAFDGGSAQDGSGRAGLGRLMVSLLDEGAGPYDTAAFHEALDEHAVELSFGIEQDAFTANLKTLVRHQDKAFELMRVALNAPRFAEAEVQRIRAQMMAGIRQDSKRPDTMASHRWFERAFKGHAYAQPRRGEIEHLELLTRDDVVAHARRMLTRDRLKVSVVGAIDAKTLAARLDDLFGGLPASGERTTVPVMAPADLGETEVIDLDVPQSTITFGMPGLLRKDEDFIAATVMNHILGGGSFTSRIWHAVRETRGLAYSVHFNLYPFQKSGLLYGSTATKNERAKEALDVIREEIQRMGAEGPSEEELLKAKSFLTGSYALRFDTSSKIAGNLTQVQIEELGIDYIAKRNSLVEAVTRADAARVASRLLKDPRMLVVAVGRPSDF